MPTTFISYNRQDIDFVEQIEHALQENEITTWREKGELYGEKGWPKVIGEAIESHNNFLAVWSKNSAISHIVEFEWNMAILLQRKILAVSLDDSAFRDNMRPTYSVSWLNSENPVKDLLNAIHTPMAEIDTNSIQGVLKKLSRFNETKPAQVTRKMRIVYFNSHIENPQVHI
ncbi:MAG: toll/interleukin-1 receptor domain-containing protein [bacterium]